MTVPAKAWGDGTYGELGGVEELSWLVPWLAVKCAFHSQSSENPC